jgi:hypothetical protein
LYILIFKFLDSSREDNCIIYRSAAYVVFQVTVFLTIACEIIAN